jgi:carbonic anhydrase
VSRKHLVHQADDLSLAVVGLFYEIGAGDETLEFLLGNDPGAFKETSREFELELGDLVPSEGGFYHYHGSLTTPACGEGVSWFVMKEPRKVAAAQVEVYQELFGGTTNRPVQPPRSTASSRGGRADRGKAAAREGAAPPLRSSMLWRR